MRVSTWIGLIVLGLIAAAVRVSVVDAKSPAKGSKPEAPVVDGTGYDPADEEKAEKRAIDSALEKVRAELTKRYGDHEWEVSIDRLRKKGWVEVASIEPVKIFEEQPAWVGREAKIQLTREFLAEMEEQARDARKEARQFFLARILIALVVLALTVAGYLRMEEATKGYYTWMLRLAVVGVLAATVTALWTVRF